MSVKASVSLHRSAGGLRARSWSRQGRYASLSAVVQRGLELLRAETEAREAELAALRALLAGPRRPATSSASPRAAPPPRR